MRSLSQVGTSSWAVSPASRAALAAFVLAGLFAETGEAQTAVQSFDLAELQGGSNLQLAVPGDLDADGWPELLAGVQGGLAPGGHAYLYDGKTGALLQAFGGSAANDNYGHSVCALGDVDLDGVPDFAIGALELASPQGQARAELRSGASGSLLQSIAIPVGSQSSLGVGLHLAGGADFDADGGADLLFAVPLKLAQASGGLLQARRGVDGALLWQRIGSAQEASLGVGAAAIGDIDGDGVSEVSLGAVGATYLQPDRCWIASGASGSVLAESTFAWPDNLDLSFAPIGDLDGDQVPEHALARNLGVEMRSGLATLAEWNTGTILGGTGAYTSDRIVRAGDLDGDGRADLLRAHSGSVRALSGASGAMLSVATGASNESGYGQALAPLSADIDGDGAMDYWVASSDADGPTSGSQPRLYLISGKPVVNWLDPYHLFTLPGLAPGDRFGSALARAGDWNGDGRSEIAIGASQDYPSWPGAGYAVVVDGATGVALIKIDGESLGDGFGSSVALLGDVDGDGLQELLVSSPRDHQGTLLFAGSVSVRHGGDGAELYRVYGSAAHENLTRARGVGDVDGDGVDDWIAGADGWVGGGLGPYPGRYEVRSGVSGALLFAQAGDSSLMHVGHSVAGAGDVDLDGVPDWIVGAPGVSPGFPGPKPQPRSFVVSGSTHATLWNYTLPPTSYEPQGNDLGHVVSSAGDLDGDGSADLLVACDWYSELGYESPHGVVRAYSGADAHELHAWQADGPYEMLGNALGPAGDLDGDGVPDVLIASEYDGALQFWGGSCSVRSGASGALLREYTTTGSYEFFGSDATCVGDLDADGAPDYAIGAIFGDLGGTQSGYVRIVSGVARSLVAAPHQISASSGGTQTLVLLPPAHTGDVFVMLGSAAGTSPGIQAFGLALPLVPDGYFAYTLAHPAGGPLVPGLGVLDSHGQGSSVLQVPPISGGALAGLTLHHAYVLLAAGAPSFASQAVPLTLVP